MGEGTKLYQAAIVVVCLATAMAVPCAAAEVDLCAGQHIDAGTVTVTNDANNLYVTYDTSGSEWVIVETHLEVADTPAGIPQNKSGNPKVGQFTYSGEYGGTDLAEYVIPLSEIVNDGNVVVAAHAIVEKVTVLQPAPYGAMYVVDANQGLRKNGTPVRPGRSDPNQALQWEQVQDETSFYALGFGGQIVMEFGCPVSDGDGNDIKIVEDTWNTGYPLETADVYVKKYAEDQWTFLGQADNTHYTGIWTVTEFDLADVGLDWIGFVKVVDTCDPALHANDADGFDLNAVLALQDYVELDSETAWGDGCSGTSFPGSSWATYFEYQLAE
jgi:hypothetical protein